MYSSKFIIRVNSRPESWEKAEVEAEGEELADDGCDRAAGRTD
jgi:hypothetical protein